MNIKRVITAALLAFVAASLVFMVSQNAKRNNAVPADETAAGGSEVTGESAAEGTFYAVYYFHGEKRCNTCLTIEKFSRNTVEEAFAEQLGSGDLRWRVFDYDLPENQHFAKDYDISFQTLMVFEMNDGEPVRWKKLDRVWDEVGSEFSFFEYVQSEVTDFMNQG